MSGKQYRKLKAAKWLLVLVAATAACSSNPVDNSPNKPSAAKPAVADRGQEVVAEFQKRDGSPYRKDHVRFTVKDEDGKSEVSEVDVWRKQTGDTTTTVSVITKPAEDAGTGSLAIQEKGKPTVNVTYASSRDEFRETDTGKMFFGGLTIQELLGEWEKYTMRSVGDGDLSGRKVLNVEAKLKPGEKSSIDSMKISFDAENYLPLEMHLFDASGKELRTYSKSEVKNSGGHSYIGKVEVDNPIYHSRTTIEVLSREYPDTMDEAVFTRERLKNLAKK